MRQFALSARRKIFTASWKPDLSFGYANAKENVRKATRIFGLSLIKKRESEFVMSATKRIFCSWEQRLTLPPWGAKALAEVTNSRNFIRKAHDPTKIPKSPQISQQGKARKRWVRLESERHKRRNHRSCARKMFRAPRERRLTSDYKLVVFAWGGYNKTKTRTGGKTLTITLHAPCSQVNILRPLPTRTSHMGIWGNLPSRPPRRRGSQIKPSRPD